MTCNECQQPISEEQKGCPNCGAPVESQSDVRGTEASFLKTCISAWLQKLVPQPNVNLERPQFSLWRPWLIVLWFIPFLGIWVGSALVAINWWTLGARRWAVWAWAFIPLEYAASALLLPDSVPLVAQLVTSFLAWFVLVAAPQIWFVQQHWGTRYDRRQWLVPIGLGLVIGFTYPKVAAYLENSSAIAASQSSEQLAAAAQSQQAVRELTVEEVVKAKSGLVWPVEVTWKETSLLIFTTNKSVQGSAVVIGTKGDTIFCATNRHVIEMPQEAENIERYVVAGDKRLQFGIVSELTSEFDLALIAVRTTEQIGDNSIPTAEMSELSVGEECVAIGNALGLGISATTGIISRFDPNKDRSLFMIRTSAPISPGNSGGGLFRRKDGKLIGITTSHHESGQNVNFVLPIEYLGRLKLLQPSKE